MTQQPPRVSIRKHFVSGMTVVTAVAILSLLLSGNAVLRSLEMINLDILFLVQPAPAESPDVAVVAITDDDYKNPELFNNTSPLNPATVGRLIAACARSGARLIAIDLDTSDWDPAKRADVSALLRSAVSRSANLPPLVWAVGGVEEKAANGAPARWLVDDLHLTKPDCQGIPAAMPDPYGVVRRFVPSISGYRNSDPVATREPVRIFNIALVIGQFLNSSSLACYPPGSSLEGGAVPDDREKLLNFRGGGNPYPRVTAGTVLGASATEQWQKLNPLNNRVVIIGGAYRAARDKYATPAGYWDGVDILAQTVVMRDKLITAPGDVDLLLADIALGALLLAAAWFMRPLWSPLLSFLCVPILALLVSIAAFNWQNYFISVVPVVLGILLHRIWEFLEESHRAAKENRELSEDKRILEQKNHALEQRVQDEARQNEALATNVSTLATDVRLLTESNRAKDLELENLRCQHDASNARGASSGASVTASSAPPDPGQLL